MRFINNVLSLLLMGGLCSNMYAVEAGNEEERLDIKIESAGTFTDGDYAPFWLISNNYGIGSEEKSNEYIRVGTFGNKKFFSDKLGVSAGIDVIASHNLSSDFYFHQIYADFKYRSLGMSFGSKERDNPFRNKYLTSGTMTVSNNARPIPQIEAGFPDFVTVPFTNDILHIQGGISYGWFFDDKYKQRHVESKTYAEDVLYHRKYAYFKLEKASPWSFVLGLEMDAQWGGDFYKDGVYRDGSPGNLKNAIKMIVPMAGGGDSNGTDQINILGNVYGSWHFILNYKKEDYAIKVYNEHFFEDHSGMFFKSKPDGLYGIEFNLKKKSPISSVLFEYVYTKNQSGPFLWDKPTDSGIIPIQVSAGDNYYNHVDYVSLTYYGMVLGNPLLTSPIYNDGKTLRVLNNRIEAFHGGISGYITDDLQYRTLLTYSRSWGTHGIPAKHIRNQFSSMLEMSYTNPKLDGWLFSGALAYDNAKTMVGDNLGFRVKLSKSFQIK